MSELSASVKRKLERIKKWAEKSEDIVKTQLDELELAYHDTIKNFDQKNDQIDKEFKEAEETLKIQLDQAGREYSTKKYKLERDTAHTRADIERLDQEMVKYQEKVDRDLKKLEDDRVKSKILLEKQKSALTDMVQDQTKHILANRSKLIEEWTSLEGKLKETRVKYSDKISETGDKNKQKIDNLKKEMESKQAGWATALDVIKKEFELMKEEKESLRKKVQSIRDEKEQELELAKIKLASEKERLEIDKRTIVEKAEADQKKCETDVEDLKNKIVVAEKELQDLVVGFEAKKKDQEESFVREEEALKEALKKETVKRDHEQKMFEQEKASKQKDLNALREEYDRKKWHWENQMRTLMMKKSVQESEHDAERLRTDREARSLFRSLEAKRDELKQKLADIKNRQSNLEKNFKKETDLVQQRWNWRKERLWNIWQERLEVLRKERGVLHEQLEALLGSFSSEKVKIIEDEKVNDEKVGDLQQFVLRMRVDSEGQRRGKEIQNELEKTRLIAQIKECEGLILDWMDRLKRSEAEFTKGRERFGEQINFIDRLYRDEEHEGTVFIGELQRAISTLQNKISEVSGQEAA